jgi:hypothetical protein
MGRVLAVLGLVGLAGLFVWANQPHVKKQIFRGTPVSGPKKALAKNKIKVISIDGGYELQGTHNGIRYEKEYDDDMKKKDIPHLKTNFMKFVRLDETQPIYR